MKDSEVLLVRGTGHEYIDWQSTVEILFEFYTIKLNQFV